VTDRSRTTPRTEADAAAGRRDEVIREAAQLFDQRGYHSTSMQDIAESVGLRKPSLYHYFGSKDEILFWIHEEFIDLLIERQRSRRELQLPTREALQAVMADILELMATHRGHVRVFFEHHRELPEEAYSALVKKRVRYQQMVTTIIERGVEDGTLRDVNVGLAALALFGMCNWAYQWYEAGGPMSTDEIAATFCDFLLNGISAQPGSEPTR
jgi:AcrR family transcriptional regulator